MIFLLSYFCIPSYLNRLGGNPLLTAPVKEPLDILASKPTDTEGYLLNNFGKFQFYLCVHINLGQIFSSQSFVFDPDDSENVDERVRILSILALCVALACVATLVTGVVTAFHHGRERDQVAAENGNIISNLYTYVSV